MKIKQKYKLICKCGKEIIGFSEHHVKKNLIIHELTSREHKEIISLMNGIFDKPINLEGMKNNKICDLLECHPYIIEDIKEIGRVCA